MFPAARIPKSTSVRLANADAPPPPTDDITPFSSINIVTPSTLTPPFLVVEAVGSV